MKTTAKRTKKLTRSELEQRLAKLKQTRAISQVGYAGAILTEVAHLVMAGGKLKTPLSAILQAADARVAESEWKKRLEHMLGGI